MCRGRGQKAEEPVRSAASMRREKSGQKRACSFRPLSFVTNSLTVESSHSIDIKQYECSRRPRRHHNWSSAVVVCSRPISGEDIECLAAMCVSDCSRVDTMDSIPLVCTWQRCVQRSFEKIR